MCVNQKLLYHLSIILTMASETDNLHWISIASLQSQKAATGALDEHLLEKYDMDTSNESIPVNPRITLLDIHMNDSKSLSIPDRGSAST